MHELTHPTPMCLLRRHPDFKAWMDSWIEYDTEDQSYVGLGPDCEELCRDSDGARFLLLFEEASSEWCEQNK